MNEADIPAIQPQQVLPPTPVAKPSKRVFVVGGILFFIVVLSTLVFMKSQVNSRKVVVPSPTPFEIITPTPLRKPSFIASSSAFMQFTDEVASFSARINSFTMQDATLTPPIFDTAIEIAP